MKYEVANRVRIKDMFLWYDHEYMVHWSDGIPTPDTIRELRKARILMAMQGKVVKAHLAPDMKHAKQLARLTGMACEQTLDYYDDGQKKQLEVWI